MGTPFNFRLSDLGDFAEQFRQTVNIVRNNPRTNQREPVATEDVIIKPRTRPQTILPTGEVILEPEFNAYLFTPNTDIREGDIITRTGKIDLFVNSIYHPDFTDYMKLGLDQKKK